MRSGLRAVVLGVLSAALLAGSLWGASSASGASRPAAKVAQVVVAAQHIHGVRGLVLVEGRSLVVYTFTGDTRGKPGTAPGRARPSGRRCAASRSWRTGSSSAGSSAG